MVFDTDGHFSLLRAVAAGRPRQVRLLLDSGIGVNHTDAYGKSPLIRAMFVENSRYQMKIARMLLRRGARVEHRDYLGRSALAWACIRGLDCIVELFLKKSDGDVDLNDTDVNDCTPLFHAATAGNAATIKLLVDALRQYDLSVDIPNEDGITPLMQAIRLSNDVCASILLHQGNASVSMRDNSHRSALDWAEATTAHSHIRTNFLPLIEKAKIERPKAGRVGRRARLVSVPSPNDSDSSDHERNLSNERAEDHTDGEDISEFSDVISSCSSRQTSSTSDSSPETPRRTFCRTPLSSCRGPSCCSIRDDVFTPENQPEQKTVLPHLYRVYAVQLTDTFRPGYQPGSNRASSACEDLDHENCQLECWKTEKGIKLPEEKILKVLHANRKHKENVTKQNAVRADSTSPRRVTQSSRLPSLRQQVTNKRFREANKNNVDSNRNTTGATKGDEQHRNDVNDKQTTPNNENEGSKQKTFPSISPGKRSLVGADNAAEKHDELTKKYIEKILANNVHYISL